VKTLSTQRAAQFARANSDSIKIVQEHPPVEPANAVVTASL